MQVEANRGPIEELDAQALAVAVFKNEKSDEGFIKKLDELSGGLISSAELGQALAGALGDAPACLMPQHGIVAVGKDLPSAVMT